MPSDTEAKQAALEELEAIREELRDIIDRAKGALRGIVAGDRGRTAERARRYWLAQLEMLVSPDHPWLGSAGCTIEDTLRELKGEDEGPDDDLGAYLDDLDMPGAEDGKKEV